MDLDHAYNSLAAWCRRRNFEGHDPFDALNSRLFKASGFKRSRTARLAWTQVFKRSPISIRKIARVPAGANPKGTALFALAALSRYRKTKLRTDETEARSLLDKLLAARIEGASGAAWGYDFDWQGRAFFAPKGTPTIVPTAFAARALVEAARDLNDDAYLRVARSTCDFIINDLPRNEETEQELCWSYSPLDRTRVFNASLLAAEALASVGAMTGEADLCELAVRGARYVLNRQRGDGSWAYGADSFQTWSDSFHTAFILTSLYRIVTAYPSCRDGFMERTLRGYDFWRERFFLADGWPKYFHDRLYPADAHSAGAALVALVDLSKIDNTALVLARKISGWAIENLRDPRGFFYYQRRRFYTVRTPYMRWSQAWMMYGLAKLLEF